MARAVQLSGLDAAFLAMEDAGGVYGHVGSVCVLDPSTAPEPLTLERLRVHLGSRMHLVPLMRRRLRSVPLGLDQPYWVADRHVDVSEHVHEVALPSPGDDRSLADVVAREHATPLDRSRPLWEITLLTGLDRGRVAVYSKIHHAAMDGVSGDDVLAAVLDAAPHGRDDVRPGASTDDPATFPSDLGVLTHSALSAALRPAHAARLGASLLVRAPDVASALSDRLPLLERLHRHEAGLPHPPLRAPHAPFNAPVSGRRTVGLADLPLDDVRAVKRRVDGTVNDVVMAVTAGALRRWLLAHDALPDEPLVAAVPVSLHAAGTDGRHRADRANQLSVMLAQLATHLGSPHERLDAAVASMRLAKHEQGAIPTSLLADTAGFAPPAIAGPGWRIAGALRLLERLNPFNLFVSNVPGPRIPLYYCGARLLRYYPLSVISHGQGLNVTVVSVERTLGVGLLACPDLVPDLDVLAGWFVEELAQLTGGR